MRLSARSSFIALAACAALAPIASTTTSLSLSSLPLSYDAFVLPKLVTLGVGSAIALMLWALSGETTMLRWHRAGWPMAAFILLAAISTLAGLDPVVSVFGRDGANGLIAYVGYAVVFLLALQHLSVSRRILGLSRAVLASGTIAAAATLYQAAVMTTSRVESLGLSDVGFLYGRGGGLFGNPDFAGAFLVLPFVLAIGLVTSERSTGWRAAAAAGVLLMGAAIVVTQVRAAWVGTIAGLVVIALLQLRHSGPAARRNVLLVGAVIAVALFVGVAIAQPSLIFERMRVHEGASLDTVSSGRLTGWNDSLHVIADRPLTGTGPDAFTLGWYPHTEALSDPRTGASSYFEDPHNVYLSVGATLGVPALLAFLILLALSLRAGLATLLSAPMPSPGVRLHAGWISGLGALLVTSVFAVTTIPGLLMIFLACAVLLSPQAHTVGTGSRPLMGARTVAGVISIAIFIAALIPMSADVALAEHMRSNTLEPLVSARTLAPWNKEIQTRYIDVRTAELTKAMQEGSAGVGEAVISFDGELYALIERHPHELVYVLKRLDLLGRAAGQVGPAFGEQALTVSRLAIVDFPNLNDLRIYEARALNNLDRYDESIKVLEPLPSALTRDIALAESYLLAKRLDDARGIIDEIDERYGTTSLAQAFLSQPSVKPYVGQ